MLKLSGIISVVQPLGVVAALYLAASPAAAQSAHLSRDPSLGEEWQWMEFGDSVAVQGRTAAAAVPVAGAVQIHTTDVNRTAWTLQTILQAEDTSPANQGFGSGLAIQGKQLVVGTTTTFRIYKRAPQGFQLQQIVPLPAGHTLGFITPMEFENGVLAFKANSSTAGNVVLTYRVNERGKAKELAFRGQSPLRTDGQLSLDADGDAMAIGDYGSAGDVAVFQRHGNEWVLKDTIPKPNAAAGGFGAGVALHGRKLVVGAPGEIPEGAGGGWEPYDPNSGAVYVYRRQNGHWVLVQRIGTVDVPNLDLHSFGTQIATNGRYFAITAPHNGDFTINALETGPASLFKWNGSGLDYVKRLSNVAARSAIDMSGRYVIAGGWVTDSWASYWEDVWIVDLNPDTDTDVRAADDSDED